mmetsp:Transcript_18909/g.48353  ORF Transcript_18909/g.48353 Transcript_18909/m.48353 type:complete len:535 (+) Transcript_18909:2044-3648(+)
MARAVHRVAELRVGAPLGRVAAVDDVGEHLGALHLRHALAHPDVVHLARRVSPHLRIVRRHERVGERAPKLGDEKVLKVARRQRLRARVLLRQVGDDAHDLLLRQPPHVRLHGVAHPRVAHARRRVALVVEPLGRREHVIQERVEELEVGEEAVDANVPREVVLVLDRARQPRRVPRTLDELPVSVPELGQPVRGAQARRSGADDDDARVGLERGRGVVVLVVQHVVVRQRVDRRRGRVAVVRDPPVPAVPDHRLDVCEARPPSDLVLNLGRVRVEGRRIARPCRRDLDRQRLARHALHHLDDLEHCVRLAVADVVVEKLVVAQRVHQLHVRVDEVGDVDVVARGRLILGGEAIAHHRQVRPQPEGHVVRRVQDARVLAVGSVHQVRPESAERIGADHVEVAEHGGGEGKLLALLGAQERHDRLLRLQLRLPVRIRRPLRSNLRDRKDCRSAECRARRREDELADADSVHRADERDGRRRDVLVVILRVHHRLSHVRVRAKVHDRIDAMAREELDHPVLLVDVDAHKVERLLGG